MSLRSLGSLFRRRGPAQDSAGAGASSSSSSTNGGVWRSLSASLSSCSASLSPSSLSKLVESPGAFRFTVPEGLRPGQDVRVRGPNGKEVDITLPPDCRPGQVIVIKADTSGPACASHDEVASLLGGLVEESRGGCSKLHLRLSEELEMQKAVWASANDSEVQPSAAGPPLLPEEQQLAARSDFSQTQAIVFAAAEDGDCGQLLAALAECASRSVVLPSFEECVRQLAAAEEAFICWQCLQSAVQKEDLHQVQLWIEQAWRLDLHVPEVMDTHVRELKMVEAQRLQKFQRQRAAEAALRAAVDEGDLQRVARYAGDCEELGLAGTDLMKDAKARLKEAGIAWGKAAAGARGASGVQRTGSDKKGRPTTVEECELCSSKELLEECRRRCLNHEGCVEREDLLKLVCDDISRKREAAKRDAKDKAAPKGGSSGGGGAPPKAQSWYKPQTAASAARAKSVSRSESGIGEEQVSVKIGSNVWDRRKPPGHMLTQRAKSSYLLGLQTVTGKEYSASELRNAYRKAAMESHPDRMQNHARAEEAKELFQQVKEAFDYLSQS